MVGVLADAPPGGVGGDVEPVEVEVVGPAVVVGEDDVAGEAEAGHVEAVPAQGQVGVDVAGDRLPHVGGEQPPEGWSGGRLWVATATGAHPAKAALLLRSSTESLSPSEWR